MGKKVRFGVIGANSQPTGWVARSHLPALANSPDVELTGVCTTRQDSADETARKYGAKFSFHDHRDMLACPEIDAVSVVVRVPSHFSLTKDAIAAGKPVYTEWPLGRTTEEAVELANLAKASGVATAVGLQPRVDPTFRYIKDLVFEGYLGEILSCNTSTVSSGARARDASRMWTADVEQGANPLTIGNGHTLDILVNLLGGFGSICAMVGTQDNRWVAIDTKEVVDVNAPDTVTVNGRLKTGAMASSFVTSVPSGGRGFLLEIFGTKASLFATGDYNQNPQHCVLHLQIAKSGKPPEDLEVPSRYFALPPTSDPEIYGVANMYHEFARTIQSGDGNQPTFDTAVELHQLLDVIRESSASGQTIIL